MGSWTDIFAFHRSWSIFLGALVVLSWSYYNVLCDLTLVFNNSFILVACVVINTFVVTPLFVVTRRHFRMTWRQWIGACAFGSIDNFLIVLMSFAFQHIPIGDASCLFALRVVWTPIVEAIWKRRCLPWGQILVAGVSVVGAVLITQPAFIFGAASTTSGSEWSGVAYLCAIGAGILASLSYILLALWPEMHWAVWQSMIAPMGWIIAPINYLAINGTSYPKDFVPADFVKLFLIALFDMLGRACRTGAVQEHDASTVALVSVLEIPFTYFWGWVYAGQSLRLLNFIGAALVMASVVLLSAPCLWRDGGEGEEERKRLVEGEGEGRGEEMEGRREEGEGDGGGGGM